MVVVAVTITIIVEVEEFYFLGCIPEDRPLITPVRTSDPK
jgi:hypothetical protein